MDQIVEQTADPLAALGANAVQENAWVGEMPRLSAALRATGCDGKGGPEGSINQRLSQVNL